MPSLALAKSRVLANVAGLTTTFFDLVREEMFGAGEQGIYMPSVHESFLRGDLFQDAAGTTPVTAAGQNVGLWLDRSKGLELGPELVVNGDFSDGLTGWTSSLGDASEIQYVGGKLRLVSGDAGARAHQPIATIAGRTYKGKVIRSGGNAGASGYRATTDSVGGITGQITGRTDISGSSWIAEFVFVATATTTVVAVLTPSLKGTTADFTNISVRELPGNHASQTDPDARPKLQQDANGMYVLRFDGVDDFMQSPFAPGDYPLHLLAGSDYPEGGGEGGIISVSNPTLDNQYKCLGRVSTPMQVRAEARYGIDRNINNPTTTGTRTVSSAAISESYVALRVNGADKGDITNTAAWNDASTAFIGKTRPSGLFFTGDIYGLIVCGAEKSLAQIERAEALVNRYTRAY